MAEKQSITNSNHSSTSESMIPKHKESALAGTALAVAATPVIADAAVTVMAVSAAPVITTAAAAAVVTTAVAAAGALAAEAYFNSEQSKVIANQINLRQLQQQVVAPELTK